MGLVIDAKTVSLEAANGLIAAGLKEATDAVGKPVSIAVIDNAGYIKAFARMDGAGFPTVQIATDKAYTASGFKRTTMQWHESLQDDEMLSQGIRAAVDRLVTVAGGIPIVQDGEVIGAVGVSGAHYLEDVQIGEAAIAAVFGKA